MLATESTESTEGSKEKQQSETSEPLPFSCSLRTRCSRWLLSPTFIRVHLRTSAVLLFLPAPVAYNTNSTAMAIMARSPQMWITQGATIESALAYMAWATSAKMNSATMPIASGSAVTQ